MHHAYTIVESLFFKLQGKICQMVNDTIHLWLCQVDTPVQIKFPDSLHPHVISEVPTDLSLKFFPCIQLQFICLTLLECMHSVTICIAHNPMRCCLLSGLHCGQEEQKLKPLNSSWMIPWINLLPQWMLDTGTELCLIPCICCVIVSHCFPGDISLYTCLQIFLFCFLLVKDNVLVLLSPSLTLMYMVRQTYALYLLRSLSIWILNFLILDLSATVFCWTDAWCTMVRSDNAVLFGNMHGHVN